jgi:hypothetical protein
MKPRGHAAPGTAWTGFACPPCPPRLDNASRCPHAHPAEDDDCPEGGTKTKVSLNPAPLGGAWPRSRRALAALQENHWPLSGEYALIQPQHGMSGSPRAGKEVHDYCLPLFSDYVAQTILNSIQGLRKREASIGHKGLQNLSAISLRVVRRLVPRSGWHDETPSHIVGYH